MRANEGGWGVFHVNTQTYEVVPFLDGKIMSREDAENEAREIRITSWLGSYDRPGHLTVEALPADPLTRMLLGICCALTTKIRCEIATMRHQ